MPFRSGPSACSAIPSRAAASSASAPMRACASPATGRPSPVSASSSASIAGRQTQRRRRYGMPWREPVRFLIVDDLPENLRAMDALLRQDGLSIHQARSGTEALELLLQHEFSLALLDVQMPDMDGFELAELMRGTERTRH